MVSRTEKAQNKDSRIHEITMIPDGTALNTMEALELKEAPIADMEEASSLKLMEATKTEVMEEASSMVELKLVGALNTMEIPKIEEITLKLEVL